MARTAAPLLLVVALVFAPNAGATTLQQRLSQDLTKAGPATGAHVLDLTTNEVLFTKRAATRRVMMSNTKLFTTGAALEAFGPRKRFATTALGTNNIGPDGILAGDLYVRGGGDPTFGEAAAASLAARLWAAGLRKVNGDVVGDGSLFDSELGPPAWELNDTPPGPVSALQFNRGITGAGPEGVLFSPDPPAFAADGLRRALTAAGVTVGVARSGVALGNVRLASVDSPPLSELVKLINKPSDNLYAETLAKLLGHHESGRGTRAAGVAAALKFGRRLGVRVEIHTGSGAFPFPRAAPRQLVKFLIGLRRLGTFGVLRDSLPIAGRDGTLADRMTSGPARGRCRAKTGSNFSPVRNDQASVLSGYCRTRGGHQVVFSIMMNRVRDVLVARGLQDRMVQAIAAQRG